MLTVGMVTYTTDDRFSAVRRDRSSMPKTSPPPTAAGAVADKDHSTISPPISEDWMLQIRGLQEADAGEYECQVNTQHPMLSVGVSLSVLCEYFLTISILIQRHQTLNKMTHIHTVLYINVQCSYSVQYVIMEPICSTKMSHL